MNTLQVILTWTGAWFLASLAITTICVGVRWLADRRARANVAPFKREWALSRSMPADCEPLSAAEMDAAFQRHLDWMQFGERASGGEAA